MLPLDIRAVRASVIDLETKATRRNWSVAAAGESLDDSTQVSARLSASPAVISSFANLEETPSEGVLSTQLGARRWAFAWRFDQRHVVVAEARYLHTRSEQPEADTARIRHICDAGLRLEATEAIHDSSHKAAPASASLGAHGEGALGERASRPGDGQSLDASSRRMPVRGAPSRSAVPAGSLLLLGLATAAIFVAVFLQFDSLHREMLRLRVQVDAAMSTRLHTVMLDGDYGEVQSELDSFASLGFFGAAAVTNDQRLVVAVVGRPDEVRVGNAMSAAAMDKATVISLGIAGQPGAQVMVWGMPDGPELTLRPLLIAGIVLSTVGAAVAAASLLSRRRRRREEMVVR